MIQPNLDPVAMIIRYNAGKAAALERWLQEVETAFDGRVLGIDNAVSDQWGHERHQACAWVNGLTLVARNDRVRWPGRDGAQSV